jgi:DNA-binding GntR family transcriptional regulator
MSGETLPSEPTLAVQLGVSRPALREELARLESEGYLRRRHGAGTIVNPGAFQIEARFDQQVEFADVLRDAGYEATVEVLDSGRVKVDAADASVLGVRRRSPALRTVKRWLADGRPAMVAVDVIPAPDPTLIDRIDPSDGLFVLVQALSGSTIEWELAWPGASVASAEVRRWLGLPGRSAVLKLDLVGVSRRGDRAYRAIEHHVPGVVRPGFVRSVRT